jgi:hypothetical protein
MNNARLRWVRALLVMSAGLFAASVQGQEYRYHYVSLTNIQLPAGFTYYMPTALDDRGRVYGMVFDENSSNAHIAVYQDGALQVRQSGYAYTSNAHGTLGGYIIDAETGSMRAALFRGEETLLIPGIESERWSMVVSVNDAGAAIVNSDPSDKNINRYRLYYRGRFVFTYQLPTDSDCSGCWKVNNFGVVAALVFDPDAEDHIALRFRPPYRFPRTLEPLAGSAHGGPFGITDAGSIAGSMYFPDDSSWSYGLWDRWGRYTNYYHGLSYNPKMNSAGLIVLSGNYESDRNSYIVPRPGERLNVMELLDNPEQVEGPLDDITAVNRRGDMVGRGQCAEPVCPTFLLVRVP